VLMLRCRSRKPLLFILACNLIIISSSCSTKSKEIPLPVNGVLDLRTWDFQKDGQISLTGYWEFYYKDFLSSRQFDALQQKTYAWVPGVWKNGYLSGDVTDTIRERNTVWWPTMPWERNYWKGIKMGGTGYASYGLIVLLPQGQRNLALKVPDMGTAVKLFINDSLVASSGKVGTTKETSVPEFLPQTVVLQQPKDSMRLALWISNFYYRKGGAWKEIVIGDSARIGKSSRNIVSTQIFFGGIWLMVCFIFLCFYLYRPRDRIMLYLFLGSVSCFIRLFMADDRLITVFFPHISFELMAKPDVITGFSSIQLAVLAMCMLFPAEFSRLMKNTVAIALVLLVVITLSTNSIIYSNLVVPYQIFDCYIMFYGTVKMAQAIIRKREGAVIMGFALLMLLISSFAQILFYNQMTDSWLGTFYLEGAVIVGFAQVILLSRLFSSALNRAENFAGELEVTVAERTKALLEAQEQLVAVARHTENEKIRRRISQDIHDDISSGLNKISWMSELVKIKAQKNVPQEIYPTLDKIIKSSRESVDNLIEIIWSLNPNSDDLENMLAYFRNYINKFFDETAFKVAINFPEHPEKIEMNPELKRNLFLVMKEALHNAAKYSHAENILLDFRYAEGRYEFLIADDGIGIEEGVVKGTGNGMMNMRRRMADVKGSFTVDSGAGKGTRIRLTGIFY
jgi:signal transduction histidine kinase